MMNLFIVITIHSRTAFWLSVRVYCFPLDLQFTRSRMSDSKCLGSVPSCDLDRAKGGMSGGEAIWSRDSGT